MSDYGPRYIPLSEIKALLEMCPQPAANDEVIIVVRAMDEAYIDYVESKRRPLARKR